MIRHALIWLCLFLSVAAYAQDKLEIFNIPANPPVIPYCKGDVRIADHIQIEGRNLDQANDGIKVSISNYIKGEDTLVYKGTGSLSAAWNNDKGEMVFTGQAPAAQYLDAIKNVVYRNLAADSRKPQPVRYPERCGLSAPYRPFLQVRGIAGHLVVGRPRPGCSHDL